MIWFTAKVGERNIVPKAPFRNKNNPNVSWLGLRGGVTFAHFCGENPFTSYFTRYYSPVADIIHLLQYFP